MIEFVKLIWSIVPFIREMIWPGKTNKEIFLGNKYAVGVTAVLVLSLCFNWLMFSSIYAMVKERGTGQTAQVAQPAGSKASDVPAKPLSPASQAEENARKAESELLDRLTAIFGK